jgi:hypothetical protein
VGRPLSLAWRLALSLGHWSDDRGDGSPARAGLFVFHCDRKVDAPGDENRTQCYRFPIRDLAGHSRFKPDCELLEIDLQNPKDGVSFDEPLAHPDGIHLSTSLAVFSGGEPHNCRVLFRRRRFHDGRVVRRWATTNRSPVRSQLDIEMRQRAGSRVLVRVSVISAMAPASQVPWKNCKLDCRKASLQKFGTKTRTSTPDCLAFSPIHCGNTAICAGQNLTRSPDNLLPGDEPRINASLGVGS